MSSEFIPYGRQLVDRQDIEAVVRVLKSDWLTTGPAVRDFEEQFATFVSAHHAVAVANGTAALHLAMLAAGIGPGDEVIVPALTFAASANCARFAGATVVFADVLEGTLTIDPQHVERLITPRTRAVVAVDYAGIPCDLDALLELAREHRFVLVEDACHAPGAEYRERSVGSIAHLSCFSFHPVKHLTTGEGGMVTTDDERLADRVRRLRNHGIDTDFRERESLGTWAYDVVELGYNYRLSDINCALGLSQLTKLPTWIELRRELVSRYDVAFGSVDAIGTMEVPDDRRPSWHLYPIRFMGDDAMETRQAAFDRLRSEGVGVNVHYLPVHLHSYYRQLGYSAGLCPVAEDAYDRLLSLPMWAGLDRVDQDRVIDLLVEHVA